MSYSDTISRNASASKSACPSHSMTKVVPMAPEKSPIVAGMDGMDRHPKPLIPCPLVHPTLRCTLLMVLQYGPSSQWLGLAS